MRIFKITDVFLPKIEQTAMNEWTISGDDTMDVSDGYHYMHELYEHRMALNAVLFNFIETINHPDKVVMKSKLHNDDTMFEGYFVVVWRTSKGQISYHYKLKHWDKFQIPVVDKIPFPFDGHGSKDVIERLLKL